MSHDLSASQPMGLMPTVLFVDDEPSNRQAFLSSFRRHFHVILASDLAEAMKFLDSGGVDVLIADQRMPGTPGSDLLAIVRDRYPSVRRMLMTAYADIQAVIDAINLGGASQYIPKPWDPQHVLNAVRRAFTELRRDQEQAAFTQQLIESNRQLEFALRQALLS